MIETPAAAIISDELAKEVDFFSIGNGTTSVSTPSRSTARTQSWIRSLIRITRRFLRMISDGCGECTHKAGIWAGICANSALTRS